MIEISTAAGHASSWSDSMFLLCLYIYALMLGWGILLLGISQVFYLFPHFFLTYYCLYANVFCN